MRDDKWRANHGMTEQISPTISLTINGRPLRVKRNASVAAAILMAEAPSRISPKGEPRSPFCGMGICMECRAMIDGVPQQTTCQLLCQQGMEVVSA
jgi:sarcosine oxidase subunit alpha